MSNQKTYSRVWADDELRPVPVWCATDGISPSTARRLIAILRQLREDGIDIAVIIPADSVMA
jgi:hypothetical protein